MKLHLHYSSILFISLLIIVKSYAQQSLKKSTFQQPAAISQHQLRGNGLLFTPNNGQVVSRSGHLRPDVLYSVEGNGANLYLRKTGVSYVFNNLLEVLHEVHEEVEEIEHSEAGLGDRSEMEWENEFLQKARIGVHQVDMNFVGSNKNSVTVNKGAVEGYVNYYYAHCPDGILNVKQYHSVSYQNIYNGIDLRFYGQRQGLEYDMIVQPHVDPNQIKLHWKGAKSINLTEEGHLKIETNVNEFSESIPKVYQQINGGVVEVVTHYLIDPIAEGEAIVSFELSSYNPDYALVIDPWVTYYGGPGNDGAADVTTDGNGNIYIAGKTPSTTAIASGGFQTVIGGADDAYLVKFDENGNRIWATYYGGTGGDAANSVCTDGNGNVYLAGRTTSSTPIALGGFQNTFGGATDAFLVKFNAVGNRIWGTYYGGTGFDEAYSVAADISGNVYLAGKTKSTTNIAGGGFQNTYGGAGRDDAFLAKFDGLGNRLWATYYGDSDTDEGHGVAADANGNVYLTGRTRSNTGISAGGFQGTRAGTYDMFLVKFNNAGNRMWGTYYGGTDIETSRDVAIDTLGDIYIVGDSKSSSAVATTGSYQEVYGGGVTFGDALLVKFDPTGNRLWATYIGGSDSDYGYSVAVDPQNNHVFISGDTYSPNFPTSPCAIQTTKVGIENIFLSHFYPDGKLVCSSYIGTVHEEEVRVAVQGCFVYLAGRTQGGLPITPGAYQTTLGGAFTDGYLAQLFKNSCGVTRTISLAAVPSASTECTNTPIDFTGNYIISCDTTLADYSWSFPGAVPSSSTAQNPTGIVYSSTGNYQAQLIATTPCDTDTTTVNININCIVLPIELTIFNATAVNNHLVQLDWQTTTEVNSDYFTVERSKNVKNWEELTKVEAAGNSSTTQKYETTDGSPYSGLSYYRLKQIDHDETFEYSDIRSVIINDAGSSLVNIKPNPTTGTVIVSAEQEELENVKIYNALGQDVTKLTPTNRSNITSLVIDLSDLSPGMYTIKTKTTANKVYKQ